MLDGTMTKPKGVALVQADRPGRTIAEYESEYLGRSLRRADPAAGRYLDLRLIDGVGLVTLTRPAALNALSEELVAQLEAMVEEIEAKGTLCGEAVKALILRGSGRAFVAGADIQVFVGKNAAVIERLAVDNMAVFDRLENLSIPVVSLIDGFALGGGNELQRLPRLIGLRQAAEMSVNGEPVSGVEAVRLGLAHELHPSSTALARAFKVAQDLASGRLELERSDWDAIAASQQGEIDALYTAADVVSLLAAPVPSGDEVASIEPARRHAARIALEAMRSGYELGFEAGLANDARLFGEVVTSYSGQHWIGRFLAKDPQQPSFLTLLPQV
jgi:enoyl-CoA hydratase